MAADVHGDQQRYETEGRAVQLDSAWRRTFVYHGAYDTLRGDMPKKGDEWTAEGVSGTWYVISSNVTRGEDGVMGTLTVTCTDSTITSPADAVAAKYEQIEVDFVEVTQPLEFHPDFLSLVQASFINTTMAAWLKFKASPLALRINNKYLDDPDDKDSAIKDLPQTIKAWAALYNRGIEDYIVHLPVVTRIREYNAQPLNIGQDLDKKEEPPSSGMREPGDYGAWLKTGDKASYDSRTGRWTRTEQWTCAAEWPNLLYRGGANA